jgi:hypothetical protein
VSAYPSKSVELLAELADEVCGVVRIVRGDQGLCLVCCGHFARIVFLEGAVNDVARQHFLLTGAGIAGWAASQT